MNIHVPSRDVPILAEADVGVCGGVVFYVEIENVRALVEAIAEYR